MGELAMFLASVITVNSISLLIDRFLLTWWYIARDKWIRGTSTRFYERQAELEPWQGTMNASVDLVIQLGYVVLFAPAFPFAALFVWLVTVGKQRCDAYVVLKLTRRALPHNVAELFGLHEMLAAISIVGMLSNTGLLFFTATQLTTLLRALPRLVQHISILANWAPDPRSNLFGLFVATEHVMLIVYWAVRSQSNDTAELGRVRAWSERFEPRWKEYHRVKPKIDPDHDFDFKKIGPFELKKVPEEAWNRQEHKKRWKRMLTFFRTRSSQELRPDERGDDKSSTDKTRKMDFKFEGSQWSIDLDQGQSWLLHGVLEHESTERVNFAQIRKEKRDAPDEENTSPRRAYGRMSAQHVVTLTPKLRRTIGIPVEAKYYAFAYPLTSFASGPSGTHGDSTTLDLDLELG